MNKWILLSGSGLWHRPSRSAFEIALCGNPSTGVVLRKGTTENEPPGPKCGDCERKAQEEVTT